MEVEVKRRGRPPKIKSLSSESTKFVSVRYRGAKLYHFNIEYRFDGPVVLVEDVVPLVNGKDYGLDLAIANCGVQKIKSIITKAIHADGVDRLTSVAFSVQLQPYLE